MADRIRVGMIGAGWMGQVHARSWVANAPRGEIVAVTDVSSARGHALSDEHTAGKARVYATVDELLTDMSVDAVDIVLPHHLHFDAIVAAASAGKHVFCEKPLCLSFDEAREIKRVIDQTGVTLVCAHNNLFQLPMIEAGRMIADGVLGRLFQIESYEMERNEGLRSRRAPVRLATGESSFGWRLDPKRMGGAELLDTGWHGFYRLLALADSRPVEVVAMLGNHLLKELGDGEDTGHVLVRFASGMQGMMLTSWAFAGDPGAWQFRVAGENGTIAGNVTRLVHATHGWSSARPAEREWKTTHAESYMREVTHFLDVLLDGVSSKASWEHAVRTLQIVKGAYLSAAERRVVTLPEDPLTL